jgi:hypothetical protein
MSNLTDIRQQLDALLARIIDDQEALAAEQAAVARATEALYEAPAVRAAIAQGQEIMRQKVLQLIAASPAIVGGGTGAMALRALRQQVREVEG